MRLTIEDKIRGPLPGFYVTFEAMHGDADLYTKKTVGPLDYDAAIRCINLAKLMTAKRIEEGYNSFNTFGIEEFFGDNGDNWPLDIIYSGKCRCTGWSVVYKTGQNTLMVTVGED